MSADNKIRIKSPHANHSSEMTRVARSRVQYAMSNRLNSSANGGGWLTGARKLVHVTAAMRNKSTFPSNGSVLVSDVNQSQVQFLLTSNCSTSFLEAL